MNAAGACMPELEGWREQWLGTCRAIDEAAELLSAIDAQLALADRLRERLQALHAGYEQFQPMLPGVGDRIEAVLIRIAAAQVDLVRKQSVQARRLLLSSGRSPRTSRRAEPADGAVGAQMHRTECLRIIAAGR